jgi:hypothetical protein
MGARLVESCATCQHEVATRCVKHGYSHVSTTTMLHLVCNDYACIGTQYLSRVTVGLSDQVPLVGTPNMHWTTCPHCKWRGWDTELIVHILSAGEAEITSRACPKCQAEIKEHSRT